MTNPVKSAVQHLAKAAEMLRRHPNVTHVEVGNLWDVADQITVLEDKVNKFV